MPGPVSDSYDCEWGTAENRDKIADELRRMHSKLSTILKHKPPVNILELVSKPYDPLKRIGCEMPEYEWRLLRFALERAEESI